MQYLRNLSLAQGHEDTLLDCPKSFIIIIFFTYSIKIYNLPEIAFYV